MNSFCKEFFNCGKRLISKAPRPMAIKIARLEPCLRERLLKLYFKGQAFRFAKTRAPETTPYPNTTSATSTTAKAPIKMLPVRQE
ncbi:hypothetical protein D3C72_1004070 [compost metagenome]